MVVVGMPDYLALMTDRARLSKLSTWLQPSDKPGSKFLGSRHFPTSLVEIVRKRDPTAFLRQGMMMIPVDSLPADDYEYERRDVEIINRHLGGKRILCLSGKADKLVPYRLTESFVSWLKRYSDSAAAASITSEPRARTRANVYVQDSVYSDTAHEFTEAMMEESLRFIHESVLNLDDPKESGVKSSL